MAHVIWKLCRISGKKLAMLVFKGHRTFQLGKQDWAVRDWKKNCWWQSASFRSYEVWLEMDQFWICQDFGEGSLAGGHGNRPEATEHQWPPPPARTSAATLLYTTPSAHYSYHYYFCYYGYGCCYCCCYHCWCQYFFSVYYCNSNYNSSVNNNNNNYYYYNYYNYKY